MPKVIKVSEINSINHLYQNGWSIRRISRELNINRRTVRKYLHRLKDNSKCSTNSITGDDSKCTISITGKDSKCTTNSITGNRVGRKSDCEPFRGIIKEKFNMGLSGERIWHDLKYEHNFKGSAQSVRRFLKQFKGSNGLPFRVLRTIAGEEVQVDFGQGAHVILENGRKKRPHLFRIVLSHSRKAYSEVVWHQNSENFLRALENAFRYFGGVPQTVVTDNLKAAVTKADWHDPEINPKLLSFARHYGTTIMPTKPYTPEHKGKVESSVKYVQNNPLKKRTFNSLKEQNDFLRQWESRVADNRIHGSTQMQVKKAFELERPSLKALPLNLFPCFEEGRRKVQRNGHVEVEKSFYSVPAEFLHLNMWVRYDGRTVRVFDDNLSEVALHPKIARGQYSTLKTHIPKEKINMGEYGSAYLIKKAYNIGPQCAIWGEIMLKNRGLPGIRVLQGLLSLRKKYSATELNHAALLAIKSESWDLRKFKNLIRTEETQLELFETHPLIRKMDAYQALTPDVFDDHPTN